MPDSPDAPGPTPEDAVPDPTNAAVPAPTDAEQQVSVPDAGAEPPVPVPDPDVEQQVSVPEPGAEQLDAVPEPDADPQSGAAAKPDGANLSAEEPGPAPQVFTRVCRRCSAQATTAGEACPACGKRYARWRPSRKLVAGVLALVLVAGSVAGGLAVKAHRDQVQRERAVAAAQAKKKSQAERDRREAEAADRAERQLTKTLHESYVLELRKAITNDVRERYRDGLLGEPATGTNCDNTDGNELDPDADFAAYDCLAITSRDGDTASGYRFTGRINYREGSYTWRLGD